MMNAEAQTLERADDDFSVGHGGDGGGLTATGAAVMMLARLKRVVGDTSRQIEEQRREIIRGRALASVRTEVHEWQIVGDKRQREGRRRGAIVAISA